MVETENKLSDFGKISCGVPQGSILGPLLVLIYVSDMPEAVKSNLLLYADDSCVMYQYKDIAKIEKILMKILIFSDFLQNFTSCEVMMQAY